MITCWRVNLISRNHHESRKTSTSASPPEKRVDEREETAHTSKGESALSRSIVVVAALLLLIPSAFFAGRFSAVYFPKDKPLKLRKQGGVSLETKGIQAPPRPEQKFVAGDPHNIPYQKHVFSRLNKLDAGDLYGEERTKAILLFRKYATECEKAGVELFSFQRIEEKQFLQAVYEDPLQWKKLEPESWNKFQGWQGFMPNPSKEEAFLKSTLNKRFVAWATRTPVSANEQKWAEKRKEYLREEHGIDYELSEEGMFSLIRDWLRE